MRCDFRVESCSEVAWIGKSLGRATRSSFVRVLLPGLEELPSSHAIRDNPLCALLFIYTTTAPNTHDDTTPQYHALAQDITNPLDAQRLSYFPRDSLISPHYTSTHTSLDGALLPNLRCPERWQERDPRKREAARTQSANGHSAGPKTGQEWRQ
jgi:hypothetical protein